MKRIIISMLLITVFSTAINAQTVDWPPKEMLSDAELKSNFLGKWVANNNGITYEMTLTTTIYRWKYAADVEINVEFIVGYMIYKRGNEVIRTTGLDGVESFLVNYLNLEYPNRHNGFLFLKLKDKERDVNGEVKLLISDDKKSATWTLDYIAMRMGTMQKDIDNDQYNRTRTFDIPKELIFYKVDTSTPPTTPGGSGTKEPGSGDPKGETGSGDPNPPQGPITGEEPISGPQSAKVPASKTVSQSASTPKSPTTPQSATVPESK